MSTLLLILDGNCVDIIRAEENEFIPHVLILHKWELDNVTFDKLFNVALDLIIKIFSNKDQTLYENIEEFDSEISRLISAFK